MPPDISRVEALPPTPRDGPGRRASGGGLGQRRPEGRAWSEGTGARSQAEGLPGPRAAPSRLRTRGSSEPAPGPEGVGTPQRSPAACTGPGSMATPPQPAWTALTASVTRGAEPRLRGGLPTTPGCPRPRHAARAGGAPRGRGSGSGSGPGPAPWLLCASVSPAVKRERKWL